jgi:hypothetical protein
MTRNLFAAILNHTDINAAHVMLDGFTQELREKGLGSALHDSKEAMTSGECISFGVRAGLVEGDPKEDIQVTADRAISKQKEIARFFCS